MAAGIPLVPTHPTDPYAAAIRAVQQQYPIYANAPITVGRGAPNLPYADETYQPGDPENPQPGRLYIQLRHAQPKTQQDLQNTIATEGMHWLGSLQPGGKPVNPQWWALKQQFRGALTPQDMALARQHYQDEVREAKTRGEQPRSFDDFMNQSYLDMFFRGYMFPQSQGEEWVNRIGRWPAAQVKILDQMQRMMAAR